MIKGILAIINFLTIALMMISVASAYINPNSVWQLSFAGLFFMPLMFANAGFALIWFFRRKWLGFFSLIALLLCWKFVVLTFGFHFGAQNEKGVKLMVWNVKNFDLYNWSGNLKTRIEMMNIIASENPDIICFQEFYSDGGTIMNNLKYLTDTLGYKHFHFEPTVQLARRYNNKPIEQKWGEATFSKHPIVNRSRVDFANSLNNDCIYSDIKIGADTIRVYNMHLQSIHLDLEDYFALQEMEESQKPDWLSIRKIMSKVKKGSRFRASQAEQVAKQARSFSGKQIICGDFNDVPVSYTYNTIASSKNFQDAFSAKGWGLGKTFVNPYLQLRIDHILLSKQMQVNSYRINRRVLSDHYPVLISFEPSGTGSEK